MTKPMTIRPPTTTKTTTATVLTTTKPTTTKKTENKVPSDMDILTTHDDYDDEDEEEFHNAVTYLPKKISKFTTIPGI